MNKKKYFFISVGLIFAFWLYFSTPIITAVANRNVSIQKLSQIPTNHNASIYYWIDDVSISGDLLNTVSIYGWAFNLPEKEQGKNISIILASDKNIYSIKTDVFPEENVVQNIQDIGLVVTNPNIRYGVSFSPLMFSNGTYRLFLTCQDGENFSLTPTNHFFEKNSKEFKKVILSSPEVSMQISGGASKGYGWVDSLKVQDSRLFITGWGFLDQMDNSSQKVFIQIRYQDGKIETYQAAPYSRIDLIGYKENMQSQNSGFDAVIDLKDSSITKEDITVFVINDHAWYSFQSNKEIELS